MTRDERRVRVTTQGRSRAKSSHDDESEALRADGDGLPRLLYIGDVPVQESAGGAALLYRLLQTYPPDKLAIVQSDLFAAQSGRRVENVPYRSLWLPPRRLYHTRFGQDYGAVLYLTAPLRAPGFARLAREFRPEAILTVAHGFSWRTAAALSRRLHVPLHLIVHDDAVTKSSLPRAVRSWADAQFTATYADAATRLCVSPYMEETFRRRYGSAGSVLLPLRAADSLPPSELPRMSTDTRTGALRFVYAGTINTAGPLNSLIELGRILEPFSSTVDVFVPAFDSRLLEGKTVPANVSIKEPIPATHLVQHLRAEADVLVLAMEFSDDERSNMEINFPTKLTDYTATGLPMLVWGPSYGSAIRWARENPGMAEVVDRPGGEAVRPAIERLCVDPAYRRELGRSALAAGRNFSHSVVTGQFHALLRNARMPSS